MKDKILKIIILVLIISIITVLFFIYRSFNNYVMSSDLVTVKYLSVENNIMNITINTTNESGYFKRIESKIEDSTLYIYVIATSFEINSSMDYDYEFDITGITKVCIKDEYTESIIYQIKDV